MKPHKQRDAKLSSLTTTLHLHPSSRAPDASDAIIPLTKRVHAREIHWFRSLRTLTSVLTTIAIVSMHTSLPNATQESGLPPKPHTTRHQHQAQKTRPRLRTAPRWLVIWREGAMDLPQPPGTVQPLIFVPRQPVSVVIIAVDSGASSCIVALGRVGEIHGACWRTSLQGRRLSLCLLDSCGYSN